MSEKKISVKKGFRVSPTKTRLKKVASMVATFLNKDSDGFQKISITTPKTEPEKGSLYGGYLFRSLQSLLCVSQSSAKGL